MTREEVARVEKLIAEADLSRESIPDVIRRMVGELPHLTTEDFEEVIGVRAEMMRMEAAEQFAIAEGEKQIAEIILEAERISGTADLTTGMAVQILAGRAAQGDKQAANLLEKFNQAALVLQLDSD
jgi:hypothetical protein